MHKPGERGPDLTGWTPCGDVRTPASFGRAIVKDGDDIIACLEQGEWWLDLDTGKWVMSEDAVKRVQGIIDARQAARS